MRLFFLSLSLVGVACSPPTSKRSADAPADSGGQTADADGDGSPADEDCDDADAARSPEFQELCDGLDNNCDTAVDEGLLSTFFADVDGDSFGDAASEVEQCAASQGWVADDSDCDDLNSEIYPGAPEACNEADDNCDGTVDENGLTLWFVDADGDGAGDPEVSSVDCAPPEGYVEEGTDCDDADFDVHPGATEACNGHDDDCDGFVDPPDASGALIWYADLDGDTYGDSVVTTIACAAPPGFVADASDCDDGNAVVHPGAPEICNAADDDCDGVIDPDSSVDAGAWYADTDGDGFGDPEVSLVSCVARASYGVDGTDCDDAAASVFPGAIEWCNDVDDDCDGVVDPATSSDASTWYVDADEDGFGDAGASGVACDAPAGSLADATDCDDGDADVNSLADEVCNGVDDDCDADIDPDSSVDAAQWYADVDNDGYGDALVVVAACSAPTGFIADDNDCDDTTVLVNPSVDEVCNGGDDDCDGVVDPDTSVDALTWYFDADSDGYGFDPATVEACTVPFGYASVGADCNDRSSPINPGATEVCDAIDNNCDGVVDETTSADAEVWYRDADADGYGDAATTTPACDSPPAGYVADATDCADGQALAYPDSHNTELPGDGIDTDCDGVDVCTDPTCDGWPDLVVGNHYDGDYSTDSYLFAGNGTTFSSTSRTSLATYGTYDADVSDIDNDGYPDILLANYYNGTTRQINSYVYWGSSSGFSATDRLSLPTVGALSAVVNDFDNDGYNDIAFANHHNDSTYVVNSYVYWGSASGWSTSDRTSLPTLGALTVLTDDFDEDGYDDLLYCNYYSGSTTTTSSYLYWGSSAGFATTDRTDLGTIGCRDTDVGDVNGDGWKDIVFSNYTDGTYYTVNSYVYYGSAAGYSAAYRTALPTAGTLGAAVADLDLDGFDDVVFGGYFGGAWTTTANSIIYWGSSLGMSSSVYDSIVTTRGIREPAVGDLDSDGWPDLVLARQYDGSAWSTNSSVYWGSATGYSSSDRTLLATVGAVAASVGDLDGDGYPEIAFSDYYNGSSYAATSYVYWGSAAGYSSTDRTGISSSGALPPIVMAGGTEW